MNISNFKWAFSEIKGLHRDLENMFDENKIANLKLWESELNSEQYFIRWYWCCPGRGKWECIIANKNMLIF